MAERVRVREIDNDEGNRLLRSVRRSSSVGGDLAAGADRAAVSAQGIDVAMIATVAFTGPDRSATCCKTSTPTGSTAFTPGMPGGPPPTFTLPQRTEITKIALSRPVDHDLPFATWSLAKLADFLVAEGDYEAKKNRLLELYAIADG